MQNFQSPSLGQGSEEYGVEPLCYEQLPSQSFSLQGAKPELSVYSMTGHRDKNGPLKSLPNLPGGGRELPRS